METSPSYRYPPLDAEGRRDIGVRCVRGVQCGSFAKCSTQSKRALVHPMDFCNRAFRVGRHIASGAYGAARRMSWESLSPLRTLCVKVQGCHIDGAEEPRLSGVHVKEIAGAAAMSCSTRASLHAPRYFCAWAGYGPKNTAKFYLCMELMRAPGPGSGGIALSVLGVVDAVWACHLSGVLHRDIKPDNFVMDNAGNLRIIDMGLATTTCRQMVAEKRRMLGSSHAMWYRAPELHVYALSHRKRLSEEAADIFALACCMWHSVTGSHLMQELGVSCAGGRDLSEALSVRRRSLRILAYHFGISQEMASDVGQACTRIPIEDVEYLRSKVCSNEEKVEYTLVDRIGRKKLSAEQQRVLTAIFPVLVRMLSPLPERRPSARAAAREIRIRLQMPGLLPDRQRAPGLKESPAGLVSRRFRFPCRMPTSDKAIVQFPRPGLARWTLHSQSLQNLTNDPGRAWSGFKCIVEYLCGNFRNKDIPVMELSVNACQLFAGTLHLPDVCWRTCLVISGLVVAKSDLDLRRRIGAEEEFRVLSSCQGLVVDPFPRSSWWFRVHPFLPEDGDADAAKIKDRLRIFFPSKGRPSSWAKGRSTSAGRMGIRHSGRSGIGRPRGGHRAGPGQRQR